MAVVACKECGQQVSTTAKACPSCGAKPPKRTGMFTWIVAGFFVLVLVMMIVQSQQRQEAQVTKAQAEQARIAALTPEQRAADAAAKKRTQEREAKGEVAFQRAQQAAIAIRKSANDPASIQWDDVGYTEAGAVLIEYRGRNAFNALVKNLAVVTPDGNLAAGSERDDAVVKLYNKHIAKQQLYRLPKPQ